MGNDAFDWNARFVLGDRTRRALVGDQFVDQSYEEADRLTSPWRQLTTEVIWADIWARPKLDLKTKSICTVAVLVALGNQRDLRNHVRGALNLGITPEELREIFIHVGAYAGFPRAGDAFEIAKSVERDREPEE